MTVVLTTSPGFGTQGRVAERIARNGWDLRRVTDAAALRSQLAQADYLVAGLLPVTAATLAAAPRLKAVLKHGVGTDNVDLAACSAAGIPVLNTPGANADAVAELALGLMFALARDIPSSHASVIAGQWQRRVGSQLGGKLLGIVGFGNIGRRLALLARGIGMRVLAADPQADRAFAEAHQVEITGLDDLLARADYVSLHVFGGAGNTALIGAAKLALMKPRACLLNLARGEVVDLDAVAAALQAGRLGGVAIDAYVSEPPDISHPLFTHPRAIFMPHSGADTVESVENVGLMVVEDLETLIGGGLPARCLNAKELAHAL